MFKRAKVLKVFNVSDINNPDISELSVLLQKNNINSINTHPDIFGANSNADDFIKNLTPKTLFCITQNTIPKEEDFLFFCSPMSPLYVSMPIRPGESIWYFEDKTFSNTAEFIIRYYWHSRIVGNYESEDNSYTADETQYQLFRQQINENTQVNSEDIYGDYSSSKDYVYKKLENANRYFPKNEELSIQGSTNSLITFGNVQIDEEYSQIDLIAGRGMYDDGDEVGPPNFIVKETKTSFITDASRISMSEGNLVEEVDNIFNDNITKNTIILDKLKKIEETSYVSFNSESTLSTISYENDSFLDQLIQNNKTQNKSNISLKLTTDDGDKPNILLKSNDIRIISNYHDNDDERIDDEESQSTSFVPSLGGEIRLIKQGNEITKTSQVLLNKNNDIILDGKTIYLGSFNRFMIDKSLMSENESLKNPDAAFDNLSDEKKIEVKNLCGKGDGILIGYEKSLSEPLVLGNTLIVLLKDMIKLTQLTIDQNKALNERVKALATEYTTHIHNVNSVPYTIPVFPPGGTAESGVSPIGAVGIVPPGQLTTVPTLTITEHQSFTAPDAEVGPPAPITNSDRIDASLTDIQTKLDDVKSNLKYVLSRFAKTT